MAQQPQQATHQWTLEQALAHAAQFQAEGKLQAAENLLRQILRNHPDNPFALHLLGVIAHQAGNNAAAQELIRKAISRKGDVPLFHANLCEILRQLGELDAAVRHGEHAVMLAPQMPVAHSNLGIALFDRKDFERAEACQKQALSLAPALPTALNNLGNVLRETRRKEEAKDCFRRAIEAAPNYLEPLNNLGALMLEEDAVEEARSLLQCALRLNPDFPDAVCNLGGVLLAEERDEEALANYRRALQLRPDYAEALQGMASALQSLERLGEAEAAGLRALALNPGNPKMLALMGGICGELGQQARAEQYFNEALTIDAECDEALLGLGQFCVENGRMEEARALFGRSLAIDQDHLAANIHLVQAGKVKADDAAFAALLEDQKRLPELNDNKALSLHFALGKCWDDVKDADRAFPHFAEGCRLKRAALDYDAAQTSRDFAAMAEIFDRTTIDRLRGAGDLSDAPIFVLGMPRSGTTLTEQIIASHPEVHGAGELPDLLRVAHRVTRPELNRFPDNLRALDHPTLTAWGAEYVAGLRQRAPQAKHITDKMPANFYAVGLIHLMLPNAKIIHVNRHPVDTCLSCFSRLFKRKQEQTYDLRELGRYYVDYANLMQHWRNVLPAGAFLDIRYEDIVADQAAATRRLLEFCGLAWDDVCMRFHQTVRPVRTASLTQVRQPIYGSSVERWRAYEKYLGPLLEELGGLPAAYAASGSQHTIPAAGAENLSLF